MERIVMTCHKCGEPVYKSVSEGALCRAHYIAWLEKQLGVWVKFSNNYQTAMKDGWKPTPLFQQMEMKP
jgi:hypothetical protein